MSKNCLFRQLCRFVRCYVDLSDNDVDLSDNDVDLSDNDVDLSDLYVDLPDIISTCQ